MAIALSTAVLVVGALIVAFLLGRGEGRHYAFPEEACWDADNPSVLESLMPDGDELDKYVLPLEPVAVSEPYGEDSTYCSYAVDGHKTIEVLVRTAMQMEDSADPESHVGTRVEKVTGIPFSGAAAVSDSTDGSPDERGTMLMAITPCGVDKARYLEVWFHVYEYANSDAKVRKAATVRLMKQLVPAVKTKLKCPR